MINKIISLVLALFYSSLSTAISIDDKLKIVINAYQLRPLSCTEIQPYDNSYVDLGEFLFDSKVLSGNSDVACSTCHIKELARTDGLKVSVGVGGDGEGLAREKSSGIIVPRNSFTLLGRGQLSYSIYFWDGKVQQNSDGTITSIVGEGKSLGYNSPLAVAASLPIIARDELIGDLTSHAEMLVVNEELYEARFKAAGTYFRNQLINNDGELWSLFRNELIKLNISTKDVTLATIGNALAAFIIEKESCINNEWSAYLNGNRTVLTKRQKEGAYLFYGKARCAACHSGNMQTDFDFHSIGIPQGPVGIGFVGKDLGRSEISLKQEDRYKFRTPPLLSVSSTPPYGHNGAFETLNEVVIFHFNPIPFFIDRKWSSEYEFYNYGKILNSRDLILSDLGDISKEELDLVLEFLKAL